MVTAPIEKYSFANRVLHWLASLLIIGLFGLGLWMTDLDYYSNWYQTAPQLHVLIGLVLVVIMISRIAARIITPTPAPLPQLSKFEITAAHLTHFCLYLLIFIIMASGYLIVASGEPMILFEWFEVPIIGKLFEQQEDIAGNIHYWSAWIVIGLALVHAAAALKHHLISGDDTLRRML